MTDTAIPGPNPRPRPRFRPVEVVGVRRLAPRLVSVALGGESLADFRIESPTQHIKVLFPVPGQNTVVVPEFGPDGPVWSEVQPRPFMRTYTPRRVDAAKGTLDVELVLHGAGPASEWAERATCGDRLALAGPGGRLALEIDDGPWVIAGDESALPAVGQLLEALPPGAQAAATSRWRTRATRSTSTVRQRPRSPGCTVMAPQHRAPCSSTPSRPPPSQRLPRCGWPARRGPCAPRARMLSRRSRPP